MWKFQDFYYQMCSSQNEKKHFIFKTKKFLQYINLTCFITLNFMTYEWPFRFIESEQKYILLKLHCDTLLNVFQKFYSTEIDEKSSREDLGSHHCINSVIINPVFPIILHLKIKTDAYLPLSKYNHDYINAGSQNCAQYVWECWSHHYNTFTIIN